MLFIYCDKQNNMYYSIDNAQRNKVLNSATQ